MMTSLRRPLGVITLILAAFACSDGNNGQVTYPKPEGPAVGHWTRLADYPETAYATYSGKVIAGDEYVSWAGQGVFAECVNGVCPNGRVLNLVTNEWREMSLDGAPSTRTNPGAIWTGTEVLYWGGLSDLAAVTCLTDGGAYNPTTDTWRTMSFKGAPLLRGARTPIWTGDEMLLWGGSSCDGTPSPRAVYDDGAAYNPTTDSWRTLSKKGAPSARHLYVAVWTGTEMIIWGGDESGASEPKDYKLLNDGYAYNPKTDSWRTLSKKGAPESNNVANHDWTGTELLLWGGSPNETMAAYNPKKDSWRSINPAGPHLNNASCHAWTGKYWVLCGTAEEPDSGALYDPALDVWQPIPADPMSGLSGMSGFPYNGDVIAMGGYGLNVFHGSDLELYRFVTPK
jgi:N-acetylneuraminic acid mutarotase